MLNRVDYDSNRNGGPEIPPFSEIFHGHIMGKFTLILRKTRFSSNLDKMCIRGYDMCCDWSMLYLSLMELLKPKLRPSNKTVYRLYGRSWFFLIVWKHYFWGNLDHKMHMIDMIIRSYTFDYEVHVNYISMPRINYYFILLAIFISHVLSNLDLVGTKYLLTCDFDQIS